MIRILFIWPPKVEYIFSIQKHYTNFGETISFLDQDGDFSIDVMDGSALLYFQWDFIEAYSKEYSYLIVYTDLHNAISSIKAAQQCKAISPKTITISYGQGTPYAPKTFLEEGFDAAITDPMYHISIKNFILFKEGKLKSSDLRGIHYKENSEIIEINEKHMLDVSKVSFPSLKKLPISQYKKISGRDQICFTVSRGCSFPCRFCRAPLDQGTNVSYRNLPDTLDYVEEVKDNYSSIKFIAASFTENRDWVMELCESIITRNLSFKWIATTRLELVDDELLRDMSKAGCIAIAFGLETLYTETQSNVDKNLPQNLVEKQVRLMHDNNIIPKAFIMLGIPGQSQLEINEMYGFLKRNKVEIRPKEYYPYHQLLNSHKKIELLRKFERESSYNNLIPGVSSLQFVKWLTDRTSVR